jgi:DNA repair exonuclease SbcCD ATPase subunit
MLLSANKEIRCDDSSNLLALQESERIHSDACVASKQEILKIEESVAQLKQTEMTLNDHHLILVEQCRKEEERVGVLGFYDMNDQLIDASKETSRMNKRIIDAVEEMSAMSEKIVHMLDGKKQDLETKVRTLKEKRQQLETLQKRYKDEKEKYDGALAESTYHHKILASECSRLQKEFLEKEVLLCRNNDIDASSLERLPELVNMTTDRHKWQGVKQMTAFTNLKNLLELKANLVHRH